MSRRSLLRWFEAGLTAVAPRARVRAAMERLPAPRRWHLLAVGKAAGGMAAGAFDAWGAPAEGLVVTADGFSPEGGWPAGVALLTGSHPVPDERSLAAGEALLALAARLRSPARAADPVVLLVSGGASALAEALVPGRTLAELQSMTRAALAGGLDITGLNAQRRAWSRLKGGALVQALGAERVIALTLSDVPGDDPCLIGSGLACGTAADSRPATLACVGRLEDALAAVTSAAAADGVSLERLPGRFAGPAGEVARVMIEAVRRELVPGRGLLWGGESTVELPAFPGSGGRNQHLALIAAGGLAGHPGALLLAAGTDGIDGVTADAGAIVDGGTARRGEEGSGRSLAAALAAADSGPFLEAAGDLIHTGPTGTNVGDILVAWWPHPAGQGA